MTKAQAFETVEKLRTAQKALLEAIRRQPGANKPVIQMTIPADPERDTDLLIGDALRDAITLITEQEAKLATLNRGAQELAEEYHALLNEPMYAGTRADWIGRAQAAEADLATLRQEITDLRSGPLSSWSQTVGILGGDEYDLGPEIAKQRMEELATLRAENNSPRDFDAPDDELLPIRKCVCGAAFDRWAQTISIYADDPTEMPCCKRKVYFTRRITVQETNR